jgi:hypothetical protein
MNRDGRYETIMGKKGQIMRRGDGESNNSKTLALGIPLMVSSELSSSTSVR